MLEAQLRRVFDVLILAAAALGEITAFRRDALGRRFFHLQQFRPRKILFDLSDFHLDRFADDDKGHEDDEIINPPDAFAPERKVVNVQGDFIRNFERHAAMLEN